MGNNLILSLLLPIALGIVMIGLGLHLGIDDFKRVARAPRAVLVALAVQTGLLPVLAFGLIFAFDLPPALGMGLVLLAASPGGVTANLFSHLARGDVALNITLTAINSALALITLPLWTALGLTVLFGSGQSVPPPTQKIVEVAVLVVLPVLIGMGLRAWKPAIAMRLDKPVRVLSTVVLALLIIAAVIIERATLAAHALTLGGVVLLFNLASLLSGYWAGRLARLGIPQATAIAFEIGIHNGTLAIFVALSVLQMPEASVIPALYALAMYLTGGVFVGWVLRQAPGT
jgi:bile acid:Na+ symporter, BASS family